MKLNLHLNNNGIKYSITLTVKSDNPMIPYVDMPLQTDILAKQPCQVIINYKRKQVIFLKVI